MTNPPELHRTEISARTGRDSRFEFTLFTMDRQVTAKDIISAIAHLELTKMHLLADEAKERLDSV